MQNHERELQDTKFRIHSLETEIYELRKQNHQLQLRPTTFSDQVSTNNYPYNNVHSAPTSYGPHGYESQPPIHKPPTSYAESYSNSSSYSLPHYQLSSVSPPPPPASTAFPSKNQSQSKSLSSMGIASNRHTESTAPVSSSSSSLLSVLSKKEGGYGESPSYSSSSNPNRRNASSTGGTPFATDLTSVSLMQGFDQLEKDLTHLMTEKATLQEESERYVIILSQLIYTHALLDYTSEASRH